MKIYFIRSYRLCEVGYAKHGFAKWREFGKQPLFKALFASQRLKMACILV